MKKNKPKLPSRREFLNDSVKAAAGVAITMNIPTIVPASVFGKNAPSNRINVASIGCGRISVSHDMAGIAKHAGARIIAVCDVDRNRANAAPSTLKSNYEKAAAFNGGQRGIGILRYTMIIKNYC